MKTTNKAKKTAYAARRYYFAESRLPSIRYGYCMLTALWGAAAIVVLAVVLF